MMMLYYFLSENSNESKIELFFKNAGQWLSDNRLIIGEWFSRILWWITIPISFIVIFILIVIFKERQESSKSIFSYKLNLYWGQIAFRFLNILLIFFAIYSLIWPEYVQSILTFIFLLISISCSIYTRYKYNKITKYTYLLQKNNIESEILNNLFEISIAAISESEKFTDYQSLLVKIENDEAIKFSMNRGVSKEAYLLKPKNKLVSDNIGFIIQQLNLNNDISNFDELKSTKIFTFIYKDLCSFSDCYIFSSPFFEKLTFKQVLKMSYQEIKKEYIDEFEYSGINYKIVTKKFKKEQLEILNDRIYLNKYPNKNNCKEADKSGRSRYKDEKVRIMVLDGMESRNYHYYIHGKNVLVLINIESGNIYIEDNSKPQSLEYIIRDWVSGNINELVRLWNKYNRNFEIEIPMK